MLREFLIKLQSFKIPHIIKVILLLLFELTHNLTQLFNKKTNQKLKNQKSKKLAVLTGGSKGIGKHILIKLIDLNYEVIVLSRTKPIFDSNDKSDLDKKYLYICLDLQDVNSIRNAVNLIGHREIHVLINNAGTFDLSVPENNFIINYFGHFLLTHFLKNNLGKESKIIFTGSSFMFCTNEFIPKDVGLMSLTENYCCSKLALVLLNRIIKKEFKIKCTVVHPGIVSTNIIRNRFINSLVSFFGRFFWFLFDTPDRAAENVILAITNGNLSNKPGKCDFIWKTQIVHLDSFFNEHNENILKKYTFDYLREKNIKLTED